MQFTLTIELGDGEMEAAHDVAGALEKVAAHLYGRAGREEFNAPGLTEPIRDRNGNTVGKWEVRDAPEEMYADRGQFLKVKP